MSRLMLNRLVVPIIAVLAGLMIPAPHAFAAPSAPPLTTRCVNVPHPGDPCWATTQNANTSVGAQFGCPNQVPLFLRSGGVHCLGGNDLVLIQCWYHGSPTITFNGVRDDIQDHVTQEDAGRTQLIGHIPDFFVNLNHQNPGDVGIRGC